MENNKKEKARAGEQRAIINRKFRKYHIKPRYNQEITTKGLCYRCGKKGLVSITPVSKHYLCDSCTLRNCHILAAFFNGRNEDEIKRGLFDIFMSDYIPQNCLIVTVDVDILNLVNRNVNKLYAILYPWINESKAI